MRQWAGPVLDLLLEHVGQVQPCSRLLELLDSREEWLAVKRKSGKQATFSITHTTTLTTTPSPSSSTVSPRPLQHLCRLQIRTHMGRHRLKWVRSLPLPDRLIRYLSLAG